MSYSKQTWASGDTVTAAKLNHMEDGIANAGGSGGGYEVVNVYKENGAYKLDKTFSEMWLLIRQKVPVYISDLTLDGDYTTDYSVNVSLMPVVTVFKYADEYRIYVVDERETAVGNIYYIGSPSIVTFTASSPTATPVFLRRTYITSTYLTVVNDF